jgi:hypothetical protein
MMAFKKIVIGVFVLLLLSGFSLYAGSNEVRPAKQDAQAPVYIAMPAPGQKVPIGNDMYMIYGFVEKPKMGPVIMKIQIFGKGGEKDTSLVIIADSWMPSMPSMDGGHDTFRLSKNGDYLTPITISMPGDWEIKLTLSKGGNVIFRGSYKFDV